MNLVGTLTSEIGLYTPKSLFIFTLGDTNMYDSDVDKDFWNKSVDRYQYLRTWNALTIDNSGTNMFMPIISIYS